MQRRRFLRTVLLVVFCGCLSLLSLCVFAQEKRADLKDADRGLLKTLKTGHPRLMGLRERLPRLKSEIEASPTLLKWRESLLTAADKILNEPPVEHVLIGPRLLDKSRTALNREYTLGLSYHLTGDRKYAARARSELLTVCAFKDWNPSHFLDVAEMTHAVAIGYDWLYDYLSPEDRKTIRAAIVNLGLKESLDIYQKKRWWSIVKHNWNQVCNGGMTIGALAIADEEPELASYIIGQAKESVKKALDSYAPDGGWAEGPGYWAYATNYTVYMLAALKEALGTDFGLSQSPGMAQTGLFRVEFAGPLGRTFNFADGGDREGSTPALFWLARTYHQPMLAWLNRSLVKTPHALDILWFEAGGRGPKEEKAPLDIAYKRIDAAFLRSAWEEPRATFIGFKGGDNRANHSHLDLGTFVLDADGQRWAVDLGADDYNLPDYFGRKRFTYYRLKTEGHNTLLINGENQAATARAPLIGFGSKPERSYAIADLSAGYAGQATRVRRGMALLERRAVLIQDEVEAANPAEVLWQMHTPAAVSIQGGTKAVLAQHGTQYEARILEPADAMFETRDANPPPPQKQNPGITKLVVRLSHPVTKTRIVVLFSQVGGAAAPVAPVIRPLDEWERF